MENLNETVIDFIFSGKTGCNVIFTTKYDAPDGPTLHIYPFIWLLVVQTTCHRIVERKIVLTLKLPITTIVVCFVICLWF